MPRRRHPPDSRRWRQPHRPAARSGAFVEGSTGSSRGLHAKSRGFDRSRRKHGIPDWQAALDHWRPVQPVDRLRHRARLPPKKAPGLAFSYVGERFKERITELAAEFGSTMVYDCDVADDAQIERLFSDMGELWPLVDGFVHSIGFATRESIAERLSRRPVTRGDITDISAYSFPAMAERPLPRLPRCGLASAYLGAARRAELQHDGSGEGLSRSQRALPCLSLGPRGIRVNGISAGPIKTLAASGIKGFGKITEVVETNAPLRRNVTIDDVGSVAAFAFPTAAGVTSEITYVDASCNAMGGSTDAG